MSKQKTRRVKLDKEELELSRSLDRGEWKSVANIDEEKEKAKVAAGNYFRKVKEKRICIRVFANDLEKIRAIAEEEGLPYQTLVTSILHKYASGHFQQIKPTPTIR
jgi:predicted DNA binding CopG/RHH family protein